MKTLLKGEKGLSLNGKPKQRKDGGSMTDDEFCFQKLKFTESLHDVENVVKYGTRKKLQVEFQNYQAQRNFS